MYFIIHVLAVKWRIGIITESYKWDTNTFPVCNDKSSTYDRCTLYAGVCFSVIRNVPHHVNTLDYQSGCAHTGSEHGECLTGLNCASIIPI